MSNNGLKLSATEKTNFQTFFDNYNTPGLRRSKVMELISSPAAKVSQPSYVFFLEHWGESRANLEQVAAQLHKFKGQANHNTSRSMIVFRQSSPEALASDYPLLTEPLSIETGTIVTASTNLAEVEHHLAARLKGTQLSDTGLQPPYVRFWTGIKVDNYQQLNLNANGDVLPVAVNENEPGAGQEVRPYEGIVSLADDLNLYEKGRQTTVFPAVYGNIACVETIKSLAVKVSAQAYLSTMALGREGLLSPNRPLPDLSLIFRQIITAPTEASLVS